MGGSQSTEEAVQPPPPPTEQEEQDENHEDLKGGGPELTLKLREDDPPGEEEEEEDWDLDLDDDAEPTPAASASEELGSPGPATAAFDVVDSGKILLRDKPDLAAAGSDMIAVPANGSVVKGVTYTINQQDWIQLEEPCKGFWITTDGLARR
uniref:Uncharacterized protein n=1 Tax=Phaeomonas parva TaxID=124430 RepID=A0A7S1Y155_9STRA|mmetsp:Transcript_9177/g.26818  ORF Transcript_9177/g.26818 Transcript_9177/m.26818 type:complete len:152 (+) Transcript_9177:331-786(+)